MREAIPEKKAEVAAAGFPGRTTRVGNRNIRASTNPLREYSFTMTSDASFPAPYAPSGVAMVSGVSTLGKFPPYTASEDVKMNLIHRPAAAP